VHKSWMHAVSIAGIPVIYVVYQITTTTLYAHNCTAAQTCRGAPALSAAHLVFRTQAACCLSMPVEVADVYRMPEAACASYAANAVAMQSNPARRIHCGQPSTAKCVMLPFLLYNCASKPFRGCAGSGWPYSAELQLSNM
jgi:hypothetical protein